MPNVVRYRQGVPNWVDASVSDLPAAVEFYTSMFGWDAADQGEEAGHYTMCSIGGRNVAGLGPLQDDGPSRWNTYLAVDDLDAVLARVEGAGGTVIVPRMDVFTSGSMAFVMDPTGAVAGLWQAGDHIGAELVNEPHSIVWNELSTRDPAAAAGFYGGLLGSTFAPMDPNDPNGYHVMSVGDRAVGGLLPMVGEDWGDMPSHWMPYFMVESTDNAVTKAVGLGGSNPVPPVDLPIGRFAVLTDPTGAHFTVMAFGNPVDDVPDGIA